MPRQKRHWLARNKIQDLYTNKYRQINIHITLSAAHSKDIHETVEYIRKSHFQYRGLVFEMSQKSPHDDFWFLYCYLYMFLVGQTDGDKFITSDIGWNEYYYINNVRVVFDAIVPYITIQGTLIKNVNEIANVCVGLDQTEILKNKLLSSCLDRRKRQSVVWVVSNPNDPFCLVSSLQSDNDLYTVTIMKNPPTSRNKFYMVSYRKLSRVQNI